MTGVAVARATFTSNLPAFEKDHRSAVDKGLLNAAEKYRSAVEDRLRTGYKSGVFVTGDVAGSLEVSKPTTVKGARAVWVFTKNFVARLWELGHENKWTRRFERVPVWRTIAVSQGQQFAAEMLKTYKSMMMIWQPKGSKSSRARRKR